MPYFPLFVNLDGRDVLVVGAGAIATDKVVRLLPFGPRLTVIAPNATPVVERLASEGCLTWHRRAWQKGDCKGRFIVIAGVDDVDVQGEIKAECEAEGIACNTVDVPERCDFYFPALVVEGGVTIGISTGGRSPAVAGAIRRWMEQNLPDDIEARLEKVAALRDSLPPGPERQEQVKRLAEELFNENQSKSNG